MEIEDEGGNMEPSGVERPRGLDLTKSDFAMPDKLDTSPNGSDLHHLFPGYGTMPGDTEEEDMPVHHTRIIRDMSDVAKGCFLPKQIYSETAVAEPAEPVDAEDSPLWWTITP